MTSLDQVNEALGKVVAFLAPLVPLIGCHMVDFLTLGHWDTLLPPQLQHDLLDLPADDLHLLPSAALPHTTDNRTQDSDDPWSLSSSDLYSFLSQVRRHLPAALGVTAPIEQILEEFGSAEIDVLAMRGIMSLKKTHEVDTMARVIARLARGLGVAWLVDLGSGRGYLSTSLVLQYGQSVVAVDSSTANTTSALARNTKLKRWWGNLQQTWVDKAEGRPVKKGKKGRRKKTMPASPHHQQEEEDSEERKQESGDSRKQKEREDRNQKDKEGEKEEDKKQKQENQENINHAIRKTQEDKEEKEENQEEKRQEEREREEKEENKEQGKDRNQENRNHVNRNQEKNRQYNFLAENDDKTNRNEEQATHAIGHYIGVTKFITEDTDLLQVVRSAVRSKKVTAGSRNSDKSVTKNENTEEQRENTQDLSTASPCTVPHTPHHRTTTTTTTTNYEVDEASTLGLVGLHTCGNLASSSLRLFVSNPRVTFLCNVGCCYHLIEEEFSRNTYNQQKTQVDDGDVSKLSGKVCVESEHEIDDEGAIMQKNNAAEFSVDDAGLKENRDRAMRRERESVESEKDVDRLMRRERESVESEKDKDRLTNRERESVESEKDKENQNFKSSKDKTDLKEKQARLKRKNDAEVFPASEEVNHAVNSSRNHEKVEKMAMLRYEARNDVRNSEEMKVLAIFEQEINGVELTGNPREREKCETNSTPPPPPPPPPQYEKRNEARNEEEMKVLAVTEQEIHGVELTASPREREKCETNSTPPQPQPPPQYEKRNDARNDEEIKVLAVTEREIHGIESSASLREREKCETNSIPPQPPPPPPPQEADGEGDIDPLHPSLIPNLGHGFPLSRFLRHKRFALGRNGRMLSSQAADRLTRGNLGGVDSLYWRALLQVVLVDRLGDVSHLCHVGRLSAKCRTFPEYAQAALARLGVPLEITEEELQEYDRRHSSCKGRLERFFLLRASLAAVVEGAVLLDRLAYLCEQGNTSAFLVPMFDPVTSPRCHALVAIRSGSAEERNTRTNTHTPRKN